MQRFSCRCAFVFLLIPILLLLLIPWRDNSKPQIESELRHLFSRDLGHTLIGAKPVSFEEWFWYRSITDRSKKYVVNFLKQNFAKSNTFILHISDSHPSLVDITLIHKPLLEKTIDREKYLKDFIELHYKSVKNFFNRLQSSQGSIFEKLYYDDRALGLIFGYGDANSSYASRRMKIQHFLRYGKGFCGYFLRPIPRPETITIAGFCTLPHPWTILPQRSIKPSAGFHSLEAELEYLDSLEHKTQEFGPPYLFEPPFFISKQCSETDRLIKHYKKSTEKLAQIYLQKSFSQFLTEQNT